MSITGEEGGGPLRAGVAMADLSTGMYATVSILIALRHAERTGEGQQIDISLLDTQIAMLANQGMNWLVGGIMSGRLGNRQPTVVPYKTFDVADGVMIIAVGNDRQFRALCDEMGRPELGTDPRFSSSAARLVNRDEIEAIVQDLLRPCQRDELMARFVAQDVFEDPFIGARNTVHRFRREEDGVEIPTVAYPGKLSVTPADYRYHPRHVGEHTRDILGQWLGLDDSALDALAADGAILQRRKQERTDA